MIYVAVGRLPGHIVCVCVCIYIYIYIYIYILEGREFDIRSCNNSGKSANSGQF